MTTLINSRPSLKQDPLTLFSNKLEELPEDKALSILRNILSENPRNISLKRELVVKVIELTGMLARPAELSKEVNVLALQSLRGKMKKMVETKISSLTAKQICSKILTRIPSRRVSCLVDSVRNSKEGSAREAISLTSIVEGMDWEGEEVVSPYFPFIKEFIKQVEAKLTGENLKEIQGDLIGKLRVFITFFHGIEPYQLSSRLKEKAIKIAGEAIGNGASFEEVMGLFHEYVNSIIEEGEIRETFPGCLIGKEEWDTHLGSVEEVSLPAGMFDILNQNCPIFPDKKAGETHTLVLIPSIVNGQPLTLNSLGALVKSKGHFPRTAAGYCHMDSDVKNQYGNIPAGSSHWVLMTKDILPGSRNESYVQQQARVKALAERSRASYEVPGGLDAIACVFLNYLASLQDERLFLFNRNPSTFTRCQELILGYPVVVGGFAPAGLRVFESDFDYVSYGVAALRKFWP